MLTRKHVKEIYWDIQVDGTHNYVTIDGAIHHNSTKTTASIMKIAYEAARVAPCKDGIRRSRCAVIRNTSQMLTDTTIPDFLTWFPEGDAGIYLRTPKTFTLRFDDVECEILFRGLDDQNDVRRLLSLQLSFAVMDEFREIHPDIFDALTGRLGRFPSKALNGVGCCEIKPDGTVVQIDKVWGATNPPDMDTYWETYLSNPPDNCSVTIQPSGLSPEADWLQYLKDGYYENLCEGKSQAWIDVYVHGKFGSSLSGKPVFSSFNRELHIAKTPILVLPGQPVLIGVDAGLTPAAMLGQVTYDGRIMGHNALISDNMGALRFVREKLKPLLANKFPNNPTLVVIDPAAFQRAQTDERTVADIYKSEGFKVVPARTNALTARLSSVDQYLTRTVDGKSAFLLDPVGCEPLIRALAGKYRYKVNSKGDTADTPEKSHPFSDIADGCQYLCMHADGGAIVGGSSRTQAVPVRPAPRRVV